MIVSSTYIYAENERNIAIVKKNYGLLLVEETANSKD